MTTRNIPGFTGEASLYESAGHYATNGDVRFQGDVRRSISASLQNTGTTRTICTACGCIASFFNCDCGNSKRKLACVENGGPGKGLFSTTFGVSVLRG